MDKSKNLIIVLVAIIAVAIVAGVVITQLVSNTVEVDGTSFNIPENFFVVNESSRSSESTSATLKNNDTNKKIYIKQGSSPTTGNSTTLNINGMSVSKYKNMANIRAVWTSTGFRTTSIVYVTIYSFTKNDKKFTISVERGISNPDTIVENMLS